MFVAHPLTPRSFLAAPRGRGRTGESCQVSEAFSVMAQAEPEERDTVRETEPAATFAAHDRSVFVYRVRRLTRALDDLGLYDLIDAGWVEATTEDLRFTDLDDRACEELVAAFEHAAAQHRWASPAVVAVRPLWASAMSEPCASPFDMTDARIKGITGEGRRR